MSRSKSFPALPARRRAFARSGAVERWVGLRRVQQCGASPAPHLAHSRHNSIRLRRKRAPDAGCRSVGRVWCDPCLHSDCLRAAGIQSIAAPGRNNTHGLVVDPTTGAAAPMSIRCSYLECGKILSGILGEWQRCVDTKRRLPSFLNEVPLRENVRTGVIFGLIMATPYSAYAVSSSSCRAQILSRSRKQPFKRCCSRTMRRARSVVRSLECCHHSRARGPGGCS